MTNYDIIGDVHGQGAKLRGLLDLLGWNPDSAGTYRHTDPNRQVIFVGDLVDRGPEQREVLTIVRAMVEAGTARIVMGNHEFNAICFATRDPQSRLRFLRRHTQKNRRQCAAFIKQIPKRERAGWIAWFRTLPLWLDEEELGGLRVIHACWHEASMQVIRNACGGGNVLGNDVRLYARASRAGDPLYAAVEVLLKGPEVELTSYDLPIYKDRGGVERSKARLCWWLTGVRPLAEVLDIPANSVTKTGEPYPDLSTRLSTIETHGYEYEEDITLMFGHYWHQGAPEDQSYSSPFTACVDYSAAKDGPLAAYQWTNGETTINPANYVCFPATTAAVSNAN
ncbi:unannotated protein [freshwater metagenome]|uniref:Unannotated protein n=1 Tax=freshwater metagenome TaxID=449393 RepID=A0A6J7L0K7_9ZZZZ